MIYLNYRITILSLCVLWVLCAGCAFADEGLVAYYPFDGPAAEAAKDRSGNGNDGKIIGQAGPVKGAFGSALKLDGKDSYVDCGRLPIFQGGNRSGSIYLWFRPSAPLQGGLVAWTTGAKPPDQRLVLALNKYKRNKGQGDRTWEYLGVYTSDGEASYVPSDGSFHEAYLPPANAWTCFAITFNGKSVSLYRNGVLFHTRFQALTPNISELPMWIGKCLGMGGPSDFFKGLIDEVRVYNRPLSDQEVYELFMRDAKGRGENTASFGAIRIKPIAMPKPGTIFAHLDYRGLAPTQKDLSIKADLLDEKGDIVANGKVRMLPAWGRAEAVFQVQKLPAGKYTVRAAGTKGKPASLALTWPGRAKGWENIKVLNNLCWELLNVSPGTNTKKQYTFTNPRRGWVFFISEGRDDVTLFVPGAKPGAIRVAGEGDKQEVMRWLPKGKQTITVSGDSTLEKLIVRSVPTLTFGHYPLVGPGTDGDGRKFLAKYVLPHVNTLLTGSRYGDERFPDFGKSIHDWVHNRGGRMIQIIYLQHVPTEAVKMREYLASRIGLADPDFFAIEIDEFAAGNDIHMWIKSHYDTWTKVCSQILDDPKYKGRMIIPYCGYNMYDYRKSAQFIKNIVDHGSYFAWEVYLHQHEDAGKAWVHINDRLSEQMDDWEKVAPGATEHMIAVLSHLNREYWNTEADFNVFMDMQFEHLATNPKFFGLAGIEEYVSHYSNEEYLRVFARQCRHYALEGRTDRMIKAPYTLTHARNSDFADGTKGWKINPAEPGSMKVINVPGYGLLQARYPYFPFTPTTVLWTQRSKEKPNVFTQEITGLQPGRLYSLRMDVGDYQEFKKGKSTKKDDAITITIENADLITDWYKNRTHKYSAYRLKPFGPKNRFWLNTHRRVFRAKGPTAKLVVTDWKDKKKPGGSIGQELMFNFIKIKPYYEKE